MNVFTPFENNRLEAFGKEFQGGKKTGRTRANYNDRLPIMDILVLRKSILFKRLALAACLNSVPIEHILTGIYRSSHYANISDLFLPDSKRLCRSLS